MTRVSLGRLIVQEREAQVSLVHGTHAKVGAGCTPWFGTAWVLVVEHATRSSFPVLTVERMRELWDRVHPNASHPPDLIARTTDLIASKARQLGTLEGRRAGQPCKTCNVRGLCSKHFPSLIEMRLKQRFGEMLGTSRVKRTVDRRALAEHFRNCLIQTVAHILATRPSQLDRLIPALKTIFHEDPDDPRDVADLIGVQPARLIELVEIHLATAPSLAQLVRDDQPEYISLAIQLAGWLYAEGDGRSDTIAGVKVGPGVIRAGALSGIRWACDLLLLATAFQLRSSTEAANDRRFQFSLAMKACIAGSNSFMMSDQHTEYFLHLAVIEKGIDPQRTDSGFPWEGVLDAVCACATPWSALTYAERLDHLVAHGMTLGRIRAAL